MCLEFSHTSQKSVFYSCHWSRWDSLFCLSQFTKTTPLLLAFSFCALICHPNRKTKYPGTLRSCRGVHKNRNYLTDTTVCSSCWSKLEHLALSLTWTSSSGGQWQSLACLFAQEDICADLSLLLKFITPRQLCSWWVCRRWGELVGFFRPEQELSHKQRFCFSQNLLSRQVTWGWIESLWNGVGWSS